MSDPSSSASALLAALPDLEASLGALKTQSWSETKEGLSTIDRAKMDVLLSYAINDLIWVYLKLKGIDPAGHEVSGELERIKKYYTKIKAAEDPQAQRMRVDKDAAHRFIMHAIPRNQRIIIPGEGNANASGTSGTSGSSSSAGPSSPRPEVAEVGDTSLAGRWRFLAKDDETERVRPGGLEETAVEEGMDLDLDDHAQVVAQDEAEAFMRGFDDEMGDVPDRQASVPSTSDQGGPGPAVLEEKAVGADSAVSEVRSGKKKNKKNKKRKREGGAAA